MTALNSAVPVEPGSADGSLRPTAIVLPGDCRALMAAMPADSVDSIVTDPPYELTSARPGGLSPATQGKVMKGFMGMEWDGSGVAFQVETWAEALRVLKPGGWLLAFSGSRTYHRMACAIEDAGFEIRDQIMWIYGSGFPKGGLDQEGRGTCLKPAHEPIVLARKPFNGSAIANVAAHGTGKLNIDDCRIGETGARNNGRQAGTNGIYGHIGATVAVDYGKGRWPANVIHDGSDDVVAGFPHSTSGALLIEVGKGKIAGAGIFNSSNGSLVERSYDSSEGSAARFFYCAKASKADRDEGLNDFAPQAFVQFQTGNGESGKASSLSDGRETQYRNTHPTVKPTALMRYLVRLVTPTGGTVLDPFTGSGSTGKAAVLEGRSFIGCELTEAYLPIARARIAAAFVQADAEHAAANPEPSPQIDMFEGIAA